MHPLVVVSAAALRARLPTWRPTQRSLVRVFPSVYTTQHADFVYFSEDVDDVTQLVIESVSQLLEQPTSFIAMDRSFLKKREKELLALIAASGYRMQHFFKLRRHYSDELADLHSAARDSTLDAFLNDD